MYNSIKLVEEHWCLQRYIWQKDLDSSKIPEEKVIKTLIYGIKSSGNQAERGLRMTAEMFKDEYPEVNRVVQRDIYVDDCLSGENSQELLRQRADELSLVLRRGGFNLKGFTFSGDDPLKSLSQDSKSVKVAGIKWFPKSDQIQLDIGELNFSKKNRGKKASKGVEGIPNVLTRRDCVSKVAEIYDLTGKVTPITASMKVDLRILVQKQIGWDDKIPDELRPVWESHFDMMKELDKVRFKRAVVPPDAWSLEMETIDAGDASKTIACSAIYVRFLRTNGKHSCQLIFSRSKLLPEGITQPRAELIAANLNAHTGEVVRRSLGEFHKSALKLTDSQIVIYWITNKELRLKQWVRSRVVEILRFTKTSAWKYVHSSNMVADIGTRHGAKISDVMPGSIWSEGFPWMKEEAANLPVKSSTEIKLSNVEMMKLQDELIVHKVDEEISDVEILKGTATYLSAGYIIKQIVPENVQARYEFSKYIYDPNKHGYNTALRVVALVIQFISLCKMKVKERRNQSEVNEKEKVQPLKKERFKDECSEDVHQTLIILSDEELQQASNYFFRKATLEVKEFNKMETYENNTFVKHDILYYKGRILPDQQISFISPLSAVMKDLSTTSFCVPVIDRHSPLAYSIVNEVHWNDKVARHTGVETVLRYTMKYAYILEGRELVKLFRKHCERCRYIAKRTIEVSMGPLSQHNLTIAPAFYVTQTDLCGPFSSYSPHNKRTTVKIWFLVFCCATTSTVNIKVMEAYNTTSFIQGFIRFACEVGYPKILLTDEGGQLMKGCKTMKLNFQDIQRRLHLDMNVGLETCPVGGHNMHGKVERKIRHIKESVEKSMHNERLSILEWETLGAQIANSINDLPIGIRSIVADLENLDLITPNRLRLGRNNDRSPVGPMLLTDDPNKFLESNKKNFDAWFDAWLISHVPNLIEQPKWFKSDFDVSEGDIVLFLKQEGSFSGEYQFGMVMKIHKGKDGKIRSADVKYRNSSENVDRTTHRAVRQLVMIHPVEELSILKELHDILTAADMRWKLDSNQE